MFKAQVQPINLDELFKPKERSWLQAGYKISPSPIQEIDGLRRRSELCVDESALIREAQHGSLDSFNQLALAYQDFLFNTAWRILGDEELAADAMQDTFIAAFHHLNSFRGGSFKAWLTRTVINTCYDELRRQKRRRTVRLEPLNAHDDEIETPPWLADPRVSLEEKFEATELEHILQGCLDALPAHFRAVIVLIDVQGMNYSEVASALHIPLGTVKSRLARARLHLRTHLQEFRDLLPAKYHVGPGKPL